jgi:hypothetical protein
MMTHRHNDLVSRCAVLGKPLAKTPKSDAGSLSDDELGVLETRVNDGPKRVDVWANELAASLDGDTESHQRRLAHAGILRRHVNLKLGGEDGEDLLRW